MNINNKNITIMGGGISGIGAAQLASYLGANVFLSDNKITLKRRKDGKEQILDSKQIFSTIMSIIND